MSRYLFRRILAGAIILLVGAHAWLATREGLSNLFAHMAHLELTPAAPVTGEAEAERSKRAMQNLETSLRHEPLCCLHRASAVSLR